jgi:DNA polymerase-3 subunit epsilon
VTREIIFDTETTGLDPRSGDRLVELGCVELVNRYPSGKTWHHYFNPDRDMPDAAFKIHGLSSKFLADKPRFAVHAAEFVEFIGDASLIAHNASFDIGFLNAELVKVGQPLLNMARVIDTLQLARRKFPGAPASLDALCKRFGIDTSKRTKHGALLDSELLAEVYVELIGERQAQLGLASGQASATNAGAGLRKAKPRAYPLPSRLTAGEAELHGKFVVQLGEKAVWRKWLGDN